MNCLVEHYFLSSDCSP